jgi:proteasome accessory factor C
MAVARPGAADRLRRLLALVPWVVANDGPTLAEVCERFDVSEEDLLEELNTVFLCGVHPFTPDVLMEVDIADGRVWIQLADYFERPLRLTPEEGLALVASGAALQAVPGADPGGPLARALDKVAAVLGIDASGALEVVLGTVPEDVLAVLREGMATTRQVEIDYYTYGRDERTVRAVEPWDAGSGSTGSAPPASWTAATSSPTSSPRATCSQPGPTTRGWSSSWRLAPAGCSSSTRRRRSRSWRAGAAG